MIKYILSIALLAMVSTSSQAQGIYKTSVYFATGQHQLNEEAENTLRELLAKINELPDFDLDLKAYTDDVGSATTNKALAKDRAKSVHNYFNGEDIHPTRSEVLGIGEIALRNENNADEQRQRNRRVDIVITPFQPKNLEEVFSHLSNRREETVTLNTNKKNIFMAQKGTIISVPKEAFQLPNGKPYHGEVNMKVKEAYSFNDFLANNLSTVSNGELIESGGMIYMEATTPGGVQLDLREGEAVSVSMPNSQSLKSGMQLFVSDRAGNDMTSATNWEATGQPIRNSNYTNPPPYIPFNRLGNVRAIETKDLVLPTRKYKPTKPVHPELYQAKYPFPILDTIKARNKQNSIETTEHYTKRIQELHDYRLATYERLRVRDSIRMDRYEKQMVVYKKNYQQYVKDHESYINFKAALKQFTKNIEQYDKDLEVFCNGFESSQQLEIFQNIGRNEKSIFQIRDYIDYITRECDLYESSELAVGLQDIDLSKDITILKNMNSEAKKYHKQNRLLYKQKNRDIVQLRGLISNMLSKGQNKHFKELQKIKDPTDRLYAGYDQFLNLLKEQEAFNTLNSRYNNFVDGTEITSTVEAIKEAHEELSKIHGALMSAKIEKGFASAQETRQYYTNSIRVSNMGWINCDRFLRINEAKMQVAINHEYNPNTQFFVVFKKIKSVISFMPSQGSNVYKCKMYNGVPAEWDVKVIGMSVDGGKTKTFVHDCKAKDLNNMTVNFKNGKLSDLRSILENV
ncbi:MAG: OmpA family protein [Aureispira sp.]|nr:OmpA family protein [Aureispira sp.]